MAKKKNFFDGIIKALEEIKGPIFFAFIVIAVLGIIVGYRYYRYTQDEPQYCAQCHLMAEAYTEWQKGRHRDVVCQKCHHLSILEQNQLLVAYVVKGNNRQFSQTHGREKPWQGCRDCHKNEISQGSLTPQKAFGHAKHVFIENIECKTCHKIALHNFHPSEDSCQKCHKDKGVHGIGARALLCFSCLKCHSFSQKEQAMIPQERCYRCHTGIPTKGPMSDILCYQCHKPHGNINPDSDTCMTQCHKNEAAVGQHGLHMKKGLKCLDCHKPHTWVVGQRAKSLCGRCHEFRDPRLFVY